MPLIVLTYSREGFDAGRAREAVEAIRESLVRNYAMPGASDAIRSFVRCRTVEVEAARCHVWTPPGWTPPEGLSHYEVEATVSPKGLDDEGAASFLREVTAIILEAEGSEATEDNLRRVWVSIRETGERRWAMGGVVLDGRRIVREALRRQRAFDVAQGRRGRRDAPPAESMQAAE